LGAKYVVIASAKYVVIASAKPYVEATTHKLLKMEEGVRCYCKLVPTNMH
jgi:hypothetical protein